MTERRLQAKGAEHFLFEPGRSYGYTKYDIQAAVLHAGRVLADVNVTFGDAQEHLLRAACIAGWNAWEIPQRLCSPRIREAARIARELGLNPSHRTPPKLSRTLFEMARDITEATDRSELAARLKELATRPLDLSPEGSQTDDLLDPVIDDFYQTI